MRGAYNPYLHLLFELQNEIIPAWRDELQDGLDDRAAEVETLINTDPKYKDLRRVYGSLAIAQWLKEQPREQVPFSELIDSNDIDAFTLRVDPNYNYWTDQSAQLLASYQYPNFNEQTANFNVWGGIKIIFSIPPVSQGNITNITLDLMENATIYNFSIDPDNYSVYYYSIGLEANKTDLSPISLWFNKTEIDFGEDELNITATIENKGENYTGDFIVSFMYDYNDSGHIRRRYIADVEGISIPPEDNVTHVSYTWIPDNHRFIGIHNISVEVDAGGYVSESNEQNNIFTETIDVVDPYPSVSIDAPLNGDRFLADDNITFIGSAYNNNDMGIVTNDLVEDNIDIGMQDNITDPEESGDDKDRGHGNDEDYCDEDNPGESRCAEGKLNKKMD